MNLDIKLKKEIVNELIDCLENKSTSFEEFDMILLDSKDYMCDLKIRIANIRGISVVFKINLTNKKSKSKESKLIYFNKPKELFEILDLKLLNVDISLKVDFIERNILDTYTIYSYYKKLIADDLDNLFKLIKYNQFSNELYLAEILALLLSKNIECKKEFTMGQNKFIKEKLAYYGYDFEMVDVIERKKIKTKLDELAYACLFEMYYGSKKNKIDLYKEANNLYREYLNEYFKIGVAGKPVMSCRTILK